VSFTHSQLPNSLSISSIGYTMVYAAKAAATTGKGLGEVGVDNYALSSGNPGHLYYWPSNYYRDSGFLLGTGARSISVVSDNSGVLMSVDGNRYKHLYAPLSITQTGGYIGRTTQNSYWNGAIYEVAVFNRSLTATELRTVDNSFRDQYGCGVTAPTKRVVADGDSITLGPALVTQSSNYLANCLRNTSVSPLKVWAWNLGVSSETAATMITNAPTAVDPLLDSSLGANGNICCFWGGTNDLALSASAATVYSRIVTYCQARQAAGWKVIVATILPRSNAGIQANFETDRITVNTNIRTNWATFADGLADVASNTHIGDAGDSDDTTYYLSDKVHPNDTGHVETAAVWQTPLDSLLAA
jgi:lysophospholipase L1-like esterase